MGRSRATNRARQFALAAAILGTLTSGCVERRVLVRTNPPGATLYVDDNEVGMTPIPFDMTYYGSHKIRLVKDGYETKTVIEPISPPWYEYAPLDFFAENTVPGTLRDMRTLDYVLTPQCVVPKEQLLSRAEGLRRGTQSVSGVSAPGFRVNPPGGYVPPAGTPGGPPIGGQPYYQLPPAATIATPQPQPLYNPPAGPIVSPAPSGSSIAPLGPSDLGSQPYFPLPSGQ